MPFPVIELLELNRLFNHRPIQTSPKPFTPQDEQGLKEFFTGLQRCSGSNSGSITSSPASTTSSLTLNDEDLSSIFMSDGPESKMDDQQLEATHLLYEAQGKGKRPSPLALAGGELNPLATPFVPTTPRQLVEAVPPPQQLQYHIPPPVPPQILPPWLSTFGCGTSTTDKFEAEALALDLVSSCPWTIEAMAELTQNFCWKGSEAESAQNAALAPFALSVYCKFWDVHGEDTAKSFLWHLRECIVGTFLACWDANQPNSISYKNAPSFSYVSSATCLTAFVGKLFAHDLIAAHHATTCLYLLLNQLASIEHVRAIHALIFHSTAKLWQDSYVQREDQTTTSNTLSDFVSRFTNQTKLLKDNMSVLGKSLKPGELDGLIAEVVDMVGEWQMESVPTPKTSLFGDRQTSALAAATLAAATASSGSWDSVEVECAPVVQELKETDSDAGVGC